MEQPESSREHLSAYERAICYYTLPSTTNPVNAGLVFAYLLCLIEAFAATVYGLLNHDSTWTLAGAICLGAIIVFGILVFMMRALLNEIRRRRLLNRAGRMSENSTFDDGLPDPFADHLLMRITMQPGQTTVCCTDNHDAVLYTAEWEHGGAGLLVKDAAGVEHLRCQVKKRSGSFSFVEDAAPSRIKVFAGPELVGEVYPRFSLKASVRVLVCHRPMPKKYGVRGDGIYLEGRLIGRIFAIRRHLYLDMQRDDLCPTVLAFFLAHG